MGKKIKLMVVILLSILMFSACQLQTLREIKLSNLGFKDENLRKAVLASNCEYAYELKELDAREMNIVYLYGIENLTALTKLDLDNNQISDIAPLTSLTSLTVLDLYNNQISDIAPLTSLTSLTVLDLDNNQISDITPLENLTGLKFLELRWNNISPEDIESLKKALPYCSIQTRI